MGIHSDETTTRREILKSLYGKTPNQVIRDHEARLLRLERKIRYLEEDRDAHLILIRELSSIIKRLTK